MSLWSSGTGCKASPFVILESENAAVGRALRREPGDTARWGDPRTLNLDRPRITEHVGFGRGKHVCAGALLARVEVRVIMEKFLAYTSKIELDREKHPNGVTDLSYEPSFIIRGLDSMHLKFEPAEGGAATAAAGSEAPA